jgi:hypothetical protein
MVETDAQADTQMAQENEPSIRANAIFLTRYSWYQRFDMSFIPDLNDTNIASICACFVPAADENDFDVQCIKTQEKLVFFCYWFRTGLFLEPGDPRIIGVNRCEY